MRTGSGDTYDVRSNSAIERFMPLINKNDSPDNYLLLINGDGKLVRATPEEQQSIK
jgi:hypothetical protein